MPDSCLLSLVSRLRFSCRLPLPTAYLASSVPVYQRCGAPSFRVIGWLVGLFRGIVFCGRRGILCSRICCRLCPGGERRSLASSARNTAGPALAAEANRVRPPRQPAARGFARNHAAPSPEIFDLAPVRARDAFVFAPAFVFAILPLPAARETRSSCTG